MSFEDAMLNAARQVLAEMRDRLAAARAIEDAALMEAMSGHGSVAAHNWQERYIAEQRVRAAELLVAALQDVNPKQGAVR